MKKLKLILLLGLPMLSGCLSMEPIAFAQGHPASAEPAVTQEAEGPSRLLEYTIPQTRHPLGEEAPTSPEIGGTPPVSAPLYTCPMHPEIVQDHEGRCPKCEMRLVPVAKDMPMDKMGEKP